MKLPLFLALVLAAPVARPDLPPVRLAIVGLVHDHARIMLEALRHQPDVRLVGIVEADPALVAAYREAFHLDPALFYPTFGALVAKGQVQAVAAFTSTLGHREVVEECAPLGIDVMVEKPMAVSLAEARAMAAAADRGRIQLVINYETTWYPSVQAAYARTHDLPGLGELRKIVARDGHRGPKDIGCSPAFLAWLTDPVQNGGGAAMDFGCYGADLITYMMDGLRPDAVTAVFGHFQPDKYPRVEDEATIILSYPQAQGIIEASWNWPYGRKGLEIYGQTGALLAPDGTTLSVVAPDGRAEAVAVPASAPAESGFLPYFAGVVRGRFKPYGLSAVGTNLVVCEILDAARESARTGRRVELARP
jgi:predicted dehydrogenase